MTVRMLNTEKEIIYYYTTVISRFSDGTGRENSNVIASTWNYNCYMTNPQLLLELKSRSLVKVKSWVI